MPELLKKVSEAAKTVSPNNNLRSVNVYGAYHFHLRVISPNHLPENVQIIYESVIDRFRSTKPIGDLGEDEAGHQAVDILHIAHGVKAKSNPL